MGEARSQWVRAQKAAEKAKGYLVGEWVLPTTLVSEVGESSAASALGEGASMTPEQRLLLPLM